MAFSPSEWPLSPKYLFGALFPGAAAAFAALYFGRESILAEDFKTLTVPAQWAAVGATALVLGFIILFVLGVPLDWIYNTTYRRHKRSKGDRAFQFARELAEENEPGISEHGDIYEWTKNRVLSRDPSVKDELSLEQGISKMFRGFTVLLLFASILFVVQRTPVFAAVSLILSIACFSIFCQRRWTASVLLYQRLRELESSSTPSLIVRP